MKKKFEFEICSGEETIFVGDFDTREECRTALEHYAHVPQLNWNLLKNLHNTDCKVCKSIVHGSGKELP